MKTPYITVVEPITREDLPHLVSAGGIWGFSFHSSKDVEAN